MTTRKQGPGYVPNPDYSEADWDAVSANPEWTEQERATAKPLSHFAPELAAAMRKTRGRQKAPTKQLVTLRLDPRVLDHFRATGAGWQTRIDEALRKAAGLV